MIRMKSSKNTTNKKSRLKRAQIMSVESLLSVNLSIPDYQRPYKWSIKNITDLLVDTENAINEGKKYSAFRYRIGTIILHFNEKTNSYDIVDGQQRCISFLLLKLYLKPDMSDCSLLNTNFSHPDSQSNIHANYLFIRDWFAAKKDADRERFLEAFSKLLEVVVLVVPKESEAFQLFDSQNTRGRELDPHDLLKAYHLREMNDLDVRETERVVKTWEDLDQKTLSKLFREYLYRLKEWIQGNKADELTEHNIDLFKGISVRDNYPYAQYYKGAFSYATDFNKSLVPFVTGTQNLRPFQINAPIVAGKPFFEYAKYYFDILEDIQNNDKYEGFFIKDNKIVKTLDLPKYKRGTGNGVTRLMFDTAILLYVDRFCPSRPTKVDTELLNRFVEYTFIWAYSMRAQYEKLGWLVAQNYIMGRTDSGVRNAYNIYKVINESDSPIALLSKLAEITVPLGINDIRDGNVDPLNMDETIDEVCSNYLKYFKDLHFWEEP